MMSIVRFQAYDDNNDGKIEIREVEIHPCTKLIKDKNPLKTLQDPTSNPTPQFSRIEAF